MNKVEHVFFDLDRTLWDFETNSRRVIADLFSENNLESRCAVAFCNFIETFEEINDTLWAKLRAGEITKEQLRTSRFYNCMKVYNYHDLELGFKMEEEYVQRSPYQKTLFPGVIELLTELKKNNF
ncbi:MAG: hypothetical protein IAF38_22040, partial [Bacteroidia bacterium]|nr:hypothetical protein [Bacteroidia bacterium]